MPASGPDRLQEERHSQNLQRFAAVEKELKENVVQTNKALSEISGVRHDQRNLRQTVEDFIYLCREEKREEKDDRVREQARREADMREQTAELRKISNRFIWFTGLIAGFSLAFQLILKFTH